MQSLLSSLASQSPFAVFVVSCGGKADGGQHRFCIRQSNLPILLWLLLLLLLLPILQFVPVAVQRVGDCCCC